MLVPPPLQPPVGAYPLLVLGSGAGDSSLCVLEACQATYLKPSDKKAGGQVVLVGVPQQVLPWAIPVSNDRS